MSTEPPRAGARTRADEDLVRHREYDDERDAGDFAAAFAGIREPLRARWYLPAILATTFVGVPWYWPAGSIEPVVFGLPLWTWISLASGVVLSALTAYGALALWSEDDDADGGEP